MSPYHHDVRYTGIEQQFLNALARNGFTNHEMKVLLEGPQDTLKEAVDQLRQCGRKKIAAIAS